VSLKEKDEQDYFSELMSSGRLIPESIVRKYENACAKGSHCPTNKDIKDLTSINLENNLSNYIDFSKLNLGSKNDINLYEDVMKAGCLVESLIRHTLKFQYGWGLPTKESVNLIVDILKENKNPLIELGAGSGLWSSVLSKRIYNEVLAFDLDLRPDTPRAKFFNVKKEDALNYIDSEKLQNLLIVWPDPNNTPLNAIEKMSVGSNLIICGPPFVTANYDFYKLLDKSFNIAAYSVVGGFAGNDELYILEKVVPKLDYNKFFENKYNEKNLKIKMKR